MDLPDLAEFHARHDLEVGAGGGASWERCCIGVPTLLIATADNQAVVVDELSRIGAAASTEPSSLPSVSAIGAVVEKLVADAELRQSLSRKARLLVDGLGVTRVALRMAASALTLRRAQPEDAELVYRWRNHPDTRAVSGDGREISLETHRDWYQRSLANAARSLFVAVIGTREVGVIRFDRRDDGYQEISLFLDPALHGLGLGRRMLSAGESAMGPDARFLAQVIDGNSRSAEMFAAAGYFNESPGEWRKTRRPH
jgi:RimJ/RimL family protein N-acetyltransferase